MSRGPSSGRATIADVARVAGVSPATVSRVLNRHPRVAPDLAERVSAAVASVNYRPNGAGRALRRQRADLWAAIVPDVRNPFFYRLIEAFEKVGHEEGFSVVLCNSQESIRRERNAIDTVIAHQVSGAVVAAASTQGSRLQPFLDAGIPVVSVDRRIDGFTGDMVNVDNEKIGWLAADHLLDQGRFAPLVLSHTAELSPMRERERGFAQRMADAGHAVAPDQIVHLPFHAPDNRELIDHLIASDLGIDAVFATTNTLTSQAHVALRAAGRSIGPDVALVGVDDDQWNEMVDPAVTVVEQPAEEVGEWAGQLLSARVAGREMKSARILLDPVLRVRDSSLRQA